MRTIAIMTENTVSIYDPEIQAVRLNTPKFTNTPASGILRIDLPKRWNNTLNILPKKCTKVNPVSLPANTNNSIDRVLVNP
jgi:hypothetical protein